MALAKLEKVGKNEKGGSQQFLIFSQIFTGFFVLD